MFNLPGETIGDPPAGPILVSPRPLLASSQSRTEATSNLGPAESAERPTSNGPATTHTPASASNNFLRESRFIAMRRVIISSTLFRRLAPVTPATQGKGDSRYNSQTLRIPSA